MVRLFHNNVSCRHHADGALQLRCCNHGDTVLFYVGRTGCFDTDGVIIGLDENVPPAAEMKNPLFVLDVTFVWAARWTRSSALERSDLLKMTFMAAPYKNDGDIKR